MSKDKIEAQKIAQNWLKSVCDTVTTKNLTGVPGFESIGYDNWAKQCTHEFENNLIKNISYTGFKLRANTNTSIMFKTYESVEAADNSVNDQGIEVIIEKEADSQWRVIQERIMPEDETKHDQLLTAKN